MDSFSLSFFRNGILCFWYYFLLKKEVIRSLYYTTQRQIRLNMNSVECIEMSYISPVCPQSYFGSGGGEIGTFFYQRNVTHNSINCFFSTRQTLWLYCLYVCCSTADLMRSFMLSDQKYGWTARTQHSVWLYLCTFPESARHKGNGVGKWRSINLWDVRPYFMQDTTNIYGHNDEGHRPPLCRSCE